MIYPGQRKAIEYITDKFQADDAIHALLISGSIAHGFNHEHSDVDINIIVSDDLYAQKASERAITWFEIADHFYPGCYFDGKFVTLKYLSQVAEHGNEPTRFALHDSQIAFDKTGQVAGYLQKIGAYDESRVQENAVRFLSQLDGWRWYCGEAIQKGDPYLLDVSVAKLILFAGRLILLHNRLFFPYHKWFTRVLEGAQHKPAELMPAIARLLAYKTSDNVKRLYELVRDYKDWTGGAPYSWTSNFVRDIETVWMRQDDCIENM